MGLTKRQKASRKGWRTRRRRFSEKIRDTILVPIGEGRYRYASRKSGKFIKRPLPTYKKVGERWYQFDYDTRRWKKSAPPAGDYQTYAGRREFKRVRKAWWVDRDTWRILKLFPEKVDELQEEGPRLQKLPESRLVEARDVQKLSGRGTLTVGILTKKKMFIIRYDVGKEQAKYMDKGISRAGRNYFVVEVEIWFHEITTYPNISAGSAKVLLEGLGEKLVPVTMVRWRRR